MKIVVAPDFFKGSLTARQAANAIHSGVQRAMPSAEIVMVPLADGGEGFADTLIEAMHGDIVSLDVSGPLNQPMCTHFGLVDHGKSAVLDMASASGLTLVPPHLRNPLRTSSYGTGELIRAASQLGVETIVVGIGGSATNDCGLGAMQALGVRFLDNEGRTLPSRSGGGALAQVNRFDTSGLLIHPSALHIRVACDVTNPLCGPNGATAVYGPQKGADPDTVRALDQSLQRFGDLLARVTGRNIPDIPGAGAAGGMGAALMAFLGATLEPGIDLVLDICQFDHALRDADLVVTGEGSIDRQTLSGKAVEGVRKRALARHVPVVAFGGRVDPAAREDLKRAGLIDAIAIAPPNMPTDEAMHRAAELLEDAVYRELKRRIGPISQISPTPQ